MKCYCYTTWNVVTIIIERIGWVIRLAPFFMKLTVLPKYPWKKYSSQSPHCAIFCEVFKTFMYEFLKLKLIKGFEIKIKS